MAMPDNSEHLRAIKAVNIEAEQELFGRMTMDLCVHGILLKQLRAKPSIIMPDTASEKHQPYPDAEERFGAFCELIDTKILSLMPDLSEGDRYKIVTAMDRECFNRHNAPYSELWKGTMKPSRPLMDWLTKEVGDMPTPDRCLQFLARCGTSAAIPAAKEELAAIKTSLAARSMADRLDDIRNASPQAKGWTGHLDRDPDERDGGPPGWG